MLMLATSVFAHDPGISTAQGELKADSLELTVGFAPADAQQLIPAEVRSSAKWTQAEFESAKTALETLAPQLWEVRAGENVLAPRETHVQLAAGDSLNDLTLLRSSDFPVLYRPVEALVAEFPNAPVATNPDELLEQLTLAWRTKREPETV